MNSAEVATDTTLEVVRSRLLEQGVSPEEADAGIAAIRRWAELEAEEQNYREQSDAWFVECQQAICRPPEQIEAGLAEIRAERQVADERRVSTLRNYAHLVALRRNALGHNRLRSVPGVKVCRSVPIRPQRRSRPVRRIARTRGTLARAPGRPERPRLVRPASSLRGAL
jgi:hypothetical protein